MGSSGRNKVYKDYGCAIKCCSTIDVDWSFVHTHTAHVEFLCPILGKGTKID